MMMANMLQSLTDLLRGSIAGDPPPPAILNGLEERLAELGAVSVDPTGDGIDRWVNKLQAITGNSRLHDTLIVRVVQMNFPRLAEALTLLGLINIEWSDAGSEPQAFRINWDQLNELLKNPGDRVLQLLLGKVQKTDDLKALQVLSLLLITAPVVLLQMEYRHQGFTKLPLDGVPGINSGELLDLIKDLVHSPVSIPLPFHQPQNPDQFKDQANKPGEIGELTFEAPADFNQLTGFALELHLKNSEQAFTTTTDIGDSWQLRLSGHDEGDHRYRIVFKEDRLDASSSAGGTLELWLTRKPADRQALLLGDPSGTYFAIGEIALGWQFFQSGPLFQITLHLDPVSFALKPDFLRFLSFGLNLPAQFRFDSTIDISYMQGKGLAGQGAAGDMSALGVQTATSIDFKVGGAGVGLQVDQVVTRLEMKLNGAGFQFRTLFRYGATARLGPVSAQMDGAGTWLGRWDNGNGGLLAPQGIGLSLEAGPVQGGGLLKVISDQELAGVMELKILAIGAFAYCLYKMLPTGEVSIAVLIGIRLMLPGIQIGFGFAVSGFGGLVGINRRADTDQLREALASGLAGDVLFNDDPMQNAPRLLGDMQRFFPDEKGIFIIGPTIQLNWLYILRLDAGFFIELPGPRKFFIAGSARLVIGSEEFALVYLRMDFIGGVDTTRSLIFFDAALTNSHVLGIFRITGGVSLRLAYGPNGYFLFSVGGFHPSFNPGAVELPHVPRVGVSYSVGPVWLKQEMYLALTSNSFQLGAKTEAGLELGPIAAHGWFGFDALLQFKPFHFLARIDAGFDVEVEDVSLCNVHLEGQLSGPGPLALEASASVHLLFIKVSGHISIELSSNPPEPVQPIANLPEHLQEELTKADNLRMEGDDKSVILNPGNTFEKCFSPIGKLIWEQKRIPLNLLIEKAEGTDLGGWHKLLVNTTLPTSLPEEDLFSVGTFLKLSDSDALNTARFAAQQSGLSIEAAETAEGDAHDLTINIRLLKLPKRFLFTELLVSAQYVNAGLTSVLRGRNGGARPTAGSTQVTVSSEHWQVHNGPASTDSMNAAQAFAVSRKQGGVALPATEKTLNLTGIV